MPNPGSESKPAARLRGQTQKALPKKKHLPSHSRDVNRIVHEPGKQAGSNPEVRVQNKASRNTHADFYDFSPVGYLTLDEKGLILELNRTAAQLLGDKRQTLPGKPFSLFVPTDFQDVFALHTSKTLGSPRRQACDLVINRKGGAAFRGRLESIAVRSEGGSIIRAVLTDVTELRELEEEAGRLRAAVRQEKSKLEMELNKLAAVVHHSSEFVSLATLDGEMIYLNEAGSRMVGIPLPEVEQTTVLQVLSERSRRKALDDIFPALRKKGCWEGELEYRNLGTGELVQVYATTFVINDPATGVPLYLANTSRDIGDRKGAEEALCKAHDELELRVQERTAELQDAYRSLQSETQERMRLEERLRQSQKMEAIGTLAGGIAHDFNNVLAGIIGFSELVEEDLPEGSPLQKYMKKILKAAFRGRDLVKQILTFSRKTDHVREPVSLSPIINETAQLLRASLPASVEIVLDVRTASDLVEASAVELQQILMNLVTNAARAIGDRGGTIRVALSDIDFEPGSRVIDPGAEPGEYVQLAVRDTGAGMGSDVTNRIFEPFFTTRAAGEGTGMGLAVVYGIVKGLHGTITVESEPQAGSTFRVFLPKASTDRSPRAVFPDEIPGGTERILFVDDEAFLAELNHDLLEHLGYRVTALTDSTEALHLFSADPSAFDLVITDHTMPKLAGLDLAENLLKIRGDIPIILSSGYSERVRPEKMTATGIRAFMAKPVEKRDLAQVIRSVLDGKGKA